MGLAESGTINQIEPLSGDPLSGLDCTTIAIRLYYPCKKHFDRCGATLVCVSVEDTKPMDHKPQPGNNNLMEAFRGQKAMET